MLPASFQMPAAVFLLAAGLLACFFGYRLFRVVLGIYGFVLGALLASSVMGPTDSGPMIVAAVAGGVIGGVLLIAAYFIGVALVGAAFGALLVHLIWGMLGNEPQAFVVILASIVGAFLTLRLQRYVIIAGTAFGGAWTMIWGAATILNLPAAAAGARSAGVWLPFPLQPAPGQPWIYVVWFVLGAIGMLIQLGRGGRAG